MLKLFTLLYLINLQCHAYTPIVLWHGMGDACCFPFSLGYIQKKLQETLPGVYVISIEIGNSVIEDVENGYFMHPDKQIKEVCDKLQNDSIISDGFHAIGFSQGAQFMRGLIQRCPKINVKTFVSLGGQHQGVYGLPNCASLSHQSCDYIRRLLNYAAYVRWVQDFLVQATYWHDPLNEKEYEKKSSFLADINNDRYINQSYIENLQSIENFVLVKFEDDTIVQPIETEWFGFYKTGQAKEIETLQESLLYKNAVCGDLRGASQPTVSNIVKRCSILLAEKCKDFLTFPLDIAEQRRNVNKFKNVAGFPTVSGCIDCTHIKISSPGGNDAEVYRNRKGYFSLNVQDRLGLRKMNNGGKLHFISTPGNHLQFEWEWFVNNIIRKYFN